MSHHMHRLRAVILCRLRKAGSDAQLQRKESQENASNTRHSPTLLWGWEYAVSYAVKDFTVSGR